MLEIDCLPKNECYSVFTQFHAMSLSIDGRCMDLDAMPRSVVWRIRLGLMSREETQTTLSFEEVIQHNFSLLHDQFQEYEALRETYSDHLVARDLQDVEQEEEEQEDENGQDEQDVGASDSKDGPNNGSNDASAAVDPLTAMLIQQQAEEDRKQALDLRYRKERALRKRGFANASTRGEKSVEEETEKKRMDQGTVRLRAV